MFTYKIEIKKKKRNTHTRARAYIIVLIEEYKPKHTQRYYSNSYLVCKLQWLHFKLMIKINHDNTYSEKRLLTFPLFKIIV